jgi:hypothetical protein
VTIADGEFLCQVVIEGELVRGINPIVSSSVGLSVPLSICLVKSFWRTKPSPRKSRSEALGLSKLAS